MKIISNFLNSFENYELQHTKINWPEQGEIRKILTEVVNKIEKNTEDVIIVCVRTIGRRIIESMEKDVLLKLVNNRRYRIYFAVKKNNKVFINYGFYKIKRLGTLEIKICKENWMNDFFETKGKHFIEKSGGVLFFESVLAKYVKIEIN